MITRQGQLRSPSAAGTAVSDVVSCCGLLLSSSVCPHQQHNRCGGRYIASHHSSEILEIKFSVESLMGFKSPPTLYCLTRMYSNGLLFIHVHDLCLCLFLFNRTLVEDVYFVESTNLFDEGLIVFSYI